MVSASIRSDEKATVGGRQRLSPSSPRTTFVLASLALIWCLGYSETSPWFTESFQTTTIVPRKPLTTQCLRQRTRPVHPNEPLYLFGRNKEGDGKKSETTTSDDGNESGGGEKKRSKIPFFGRLKKKKEGDSEEPQPEAKLLSEQKPPEPPKPQTASDTVTASAATVATAAAATTAAAAATTTTTTTAPKKKTSPTASDLKLMAEKARLEAERLDAELTLSKIEKLEQQLIRSKKEETDSSLVVEDLQNQLDVLQAKLRGEPVPKIQKAAVQPKETVAPASSASTSSSGEKPLSPNSIQLPVATLEKPRTGALVEIDDAKVLEAAATIAASQKDSMANLQNEQDLSMAPEIFLGMMAPFYGLKPGPNGKIDRKELVNRWNMTKNLDYSFFDEMSPPDFDRSEIRKRKSAIIEADASKMRNGVANGKWEFTLGDVTLQPVTVTREMVSRADGNATQLAIYSLEYDYYLLKGGEEFFGENSAVVGDLFQNASYFGQMYPKCVTSREENKGDDYVSEEPTEAMMEVLTTKILPAVKFSSSARPYKVPGGYAITGNHKFETGDDLIQAIDDEIARSRPNLKDQITVLYTPSYGPLESPKGEGVDMKNMDLENLLQDDVLDMFAETEPILYITGPNIVRDTNPVALAFTSILGLATSWYLSVYPFLLNQKIASRIDADLQLVESGLQPDLSYLTDLCLPLFGWFMAFQLVHEAAHRVTAWSKGVKLSVPVFVPSFITGITSAVTTFKTLPKNKNDMFDISAAGPLAGVVVSSIALAIGSKLTLVSDPATLPALPLGILRQSTLGGAIIDNIIPGTLYLPEGAPSDGLFINLHPVAVAGFVSLIVNALALLPIGSTDGGRLTMALFDRAEKMSIGSLALFSIFAAGIFGSDLFLFYFSFCLAFQTGNEVPARNEQDSVEFSRVIVALVCYLLAILTLVPVQ